MTITHPDHKKKILMSLIDDMAAAAIDKTGHGYQQFLQCRTELMETIDRYMEEDKKRLELTQSIAQQIVSSLEDCTCTTIHA